MPVKIRWSIHYTILMAQLLFHIELYAQVDNLLIGKWIYGNVRRVEETEPLSEMTMRFVVGDSGYFHFLPNHRFKTCESTCVLGQWEIIDNGKKLSLVTDEGRLIWYAIEKLTGDTLMLNIRNKTIHTLVQGPNAADFLDKSPPSMQGLVKASPAKLINRWRLEKIVNVQQKEVADFASRLLLGYVYEFKAQGICTTKLRKEQTGRWELRANSTAIAMNFEYDGNYWRILSLTDTELILGKPGSTDRVVFRAF